MIRIVLIALVSLVALTAYPASAAGQDASPVSTAQQQGTQEPAFTAAPAAEAAPGLPQRTGVDRTMRGYWHLFIAFAFTWLLLFGYAISLGRRFGALEKRLERQGNG
jgi:CcmD family protein